MTSKAGFPTQISVRAKTHAKIKAAAKANGTTMTSIVEAACLSLPVVDPLEGVR